MEGEVTVCVVGEGRKEEGGGRFVGWAEEEW